MFDRLDSGPPRDRMSDRTQQGGGSWDQRMVEVNVNPQDVPRGKRYFMVCIWLCYYVLVSSINEYTGLDTNKDLHGTAWSIISS